MHRVFLLYLLCDFSFIFCMDQKLDSTIKKIISMPDTEQVAFLGNDILVMHKPKFFFEKDFHSIAQKLSTNTSTNIVENLRIKEANNLEVDYNKEKIMFPYRSKGKWRALVYDVKGNKYHTPSFCTYEGGGGWPEHGFLGKSNQLFLTTVEDCETVIKSCDDTTGVFTLHEDITKFIKKDDPDLYIIKYLPQNKIICGYRSRTGYCIYDLENFQLTNTIYLPMYSQSLQSSSDASFLLFNYQPNKIICEKMFLQGSSCNCHKIPVVFLKNNKIIEIVDENDDPKKNHQGRCGLAIHPNNRVIARLKNNVISYWNVYTRKKYDFSHVYNNCVEEKASSYFYRKCLSFSLDGTLIAGAFPRAYVVFSVPFEVRYGIHIKKEKLFTIWAALKKYQYDNMFSPDILQYIMKKVWKVSKWIE